MNRCPCKCGRLVKPGKRYATAPCVFRAMSRAKKVRAGRQGGRTRAIGIHQRLLASVATLDRDAAILRAYYLGRRAAYNDKWQRGKAA